MKRIASLLFLIICLQVVRGQSATREGETVTNVRVTLLQTIKEPKTVIIYEDSLYVIKTSFAAFEKNLLARLKINPYLEDDNELLEMVKKKIKETNTVDAVKPTLGGNLMYRLYFMLADLLEKGNCQVTDKKTTKVVPKITAQSYTYDCGGLCHNTGRRFFIDTIQFFEVYDNAFF